LEATGCQFGKYVEKKRKILELIFVVDPKLKILWELIFADDRKLL